MKSFLALTCFALASLITFGTANAQSHKVRAVIPFNFNAGGAVLPAGTYTISSEDSLFVAIQNGNQHVILLTSAQIGGNKSEHGRLIFKHYGDQYFLNKILCSDAHMDFELPLSRKEMQARLQAMNPRRDKAVFIALNQ
jgi:hypothetical protein